MKNSILLLLVVILSYNLNTQTDLNIYLNSKILDTERKIKIHLPKSYEENTNKNYPLILVLDAEHTFYFTVGNTEIFYDPDPDFELVTETIVVGIYQNYSLDGTTYNYVRNYDASWDNDTDKFSDSSAKFYDFVKNELVQYLNKNYRIGNFKAILGHSLTASFVSSMLLENDDVFNAYIMLSPNWEDFNDTLFDAIDAKKQTKLVYTSTASNDAPGHLSSILNLHNNYFSKKIFENINYEYNYFEDEGHMSLISRSIPFALEHIYSLYNPINNIKIEDFISSENKIEFLNSAYEKSNQLYGTNRLLRDSDLELLADLAIDSENWKILKEISDINIKYFPNLQTGYFTRAVYEEKYNKDLKTALKFYKLSLKNLEKSITSRFFWVNEIKRVEKLLADE